MKNNEKIMKLHREPSSKYGLNPDQFEKDMENHQQEVEQLYKDFKQFMIDHNVTPESFRQLFIDYYEEYIA